MCKFFLSVETVQIKSTKWSLICANLLKVEKSFNANKVHAEHESITSTVLNVSGFY